MDASSEQLDRAIAQFAGAFEVVFEEDWEYTLEQFLSQGKRISGEGTFLFPDTDSRGVNWNARATLLEAYERLVKAMKERNLKPLRPKRDEWFFFDWDD